jgi:hypothetical protein
MPALWNDPEHWRSRAEEARATADQLQDLEAKRVMLGIAEGYDELAARAESRKQSSAGAHADRRGHRGF